MPSIIRRSCILFPNSNFQLIYKGVLDQTQMPYEMMCILTMKFEVREFSKLLVKDNSIYFCLNNDESIMPRYILVTIICSLNGNKKVFLTFAMM